MDIIIPAYNEGENIKSVLMALQKNVKTPFRVLICYDYDGDNTLEAVNELRPVLNFEIEFVKNRGGGVHSAVRTGLEASRAADAIVVYMADDDSNAGLIDKMYSMISQGYDVVAASRFMKGGKVISAPVVKSWIVRFASFTLHWLARIPVRDATNGFRMFSRRVIDQINIESREGFTYSIELLVKCHRLGWKIGEVPVLWIERKSGKSRFRLLKWLPHYLKWYYYAFKTTYSKNKKSCINDVLKTGTRYGTSININCCQICGNSNLELLIFFGYFSPPNTVNKISCGPHEQSIYPMQLLFCSRCNLVQSGTIVDQKILFPPEFPYTAGTTKMLRDNFAELFRECVSIINLKRDDLVVDIGSNDGTLLANFKDSCNVLGVTPEEIGKLAIEKGIPTIIDYFNQEIAEEIVRERSRAKVVTGTNVFAHIEDVNGAVENILKLLKKDGVFISESQYLFATIKKLQYDTVYHEHLRFYSLHSLKYLFEMHGMEIFYAKEIPTHGGSIRVYAARKGEYPVRGEVAELLQKERGTVTNKEELLRFKQRVVISKLELYSKLLEIKKKGGRIYGIGAAARASTLINYVGLDDGIIDYVVETKGSHKIGNYVPGTIIPIAEESILYQDQPDYALLLSWHIADELMPKLREKGFKGKFIIPLPEPRIVE